MTWTLDSSGTNTPVVGTELALATSTQNATFYFQTRCNNMVNGDITELRIYTITLSGGTLELTWKTVVGPSPPPCFVIASPPVPSDQSIRVSIKQTAGTARAFDWKLLRI